MSEGDAALYHEPFEYVRATVKPARLENRREKRRVYWWRHGETSPGLRAALAPLKRFIVTPRVAKHRIFVWAATPTLPDSAVIAIARSDDFTFGILHSRFHEAWSLRLGTSLEDRPRYTPSTTFETFPFPDGMTLSVSAALLAADQRAGAIAKAAKRLDELRSSWIIPTKLVRAETEVVEGYPDRLVPVNHSAWQQLAARTLTTLYNERPTWLADAHDELDAAVAAAYGWPADISTDDALEKLLELNAARSSSA